VPSKSADRLSEPTKAGVLKFLIQQNPFANIFEEVLYTLFFCFFSYPHQYPADAEIAVYQVRNSALSRVHREIFCLQHVIHGEDNAKGGLSCEGFVIDKVSLSHRLNHGSVQGPIRHLL